MNEYLINLLLKINASTQGDEYYAYEPQNFSNSEDARREEDGLLELKDMGYIEISERKNNMIRRDSTRYLNILVKDITYKGNKFIKEHLAKGNPESLRDPPINDYCTNQSNLQVQNQNLLIIKIKDLEKQWSLLSEKLNKLNEQKILETRADEKMRLQCLINQSESERDQIEKKLEKLKSQLPNTNSDDFFDQPDMLCNALISHALQTQGWKPSNAFPGEFMCMTSLVPFGLLGCNGMENNIAYYIYGTQADRANKIIIKININNPNEKAQAFDRLNTATKTLFKAIGEQIPMELSEALAAQESLSLDTAFGEVELVHEPGNIDSFKIVLTDQRFLASRQANKAIFADDFEACRLAVAKAAGYSILSITGDGQPTNESDYRSFLLNGKNNDIFFCEIYPGRKYKIKAALGGKFPFNYIAEGIL